MSQISAAGLGALHVPLASILPANDESLARLRGVPAVALEWLPGISFVAYHVNGAFGSHPDDMVCRSIMELYNLESKLANAGADYAVHGVIVGPGILDNPLGLDSLTLFGLDVYDATAQHWEDWQYVMIGFRHFGFEPVPDIRTWWTFNAKLDGLKTLAERQYNTGKPSRGLLIRPLRHEQRDPFYVSVDNPARGNM